MNVTGLSKAGRGITGRINQRICSEYNQSDSHMHAVCGYSIPRVTINHVMIYAFQDEIA